MSEGQIRIGIGGWNYPPWRGTFYPDKLPQKRELEYASRALTAIEINATFYGRQKPPRAGRTGRGRSPTASSSRSRRRAIASAARSSPRAPTASPISSARGSTCSGPSSARSCGSWRRSSGSTATTSPRSSTCIPDELDGIKLRHAFEPRHESFSDDKFFELCRARDIAVVFDDSDEYPGHRRRHRELRLRPAAADARGGPDRL